MNQLLPRSLDDGRAVIDALPVGMAVYDENLRLVLANSALTETLGLAPGAFRPGSTLIENTRTLAYQGAFGPGDPELHAAEVVSLDFTQGRRLWRRRADGRSYEAHHVPLPHGGLLICVVDTSSLVSLRESAERLGAALTDAQADVGNKADLLARIVSHIPHGVGVYGPDRGLRLVNAAYGRIMAGAPVELGETVDAIIERRAHAGEFGPGDPASIAEAQRSHDLTSPQLRRRRRPNGMTIDVRTAPLPDGGHISVVTDVTSLVTAEQEAERRAETMDAMLANIRHGIILWNEEGRIVAANAVVAQMLGAPEGLLVPGRSLEEANQSALDRGNLGTGATAEARARWLMEQDRSKPHHDQRLTQGGRVLEVRSDPTPQGGFVTTYTDVTQTRQAEEALQLAKHAAEAANVAKSRFLAAMSTELRTPLTTILSQVGGMSRDAAGVRALQLGDDPQNGLDAAEIQHSCDAVSDAARQLLGLIDTILDVARLEAGRFGLSDDMLDVPQLVRLCLRQSDSAAAAAEVTLLADLPEQLPRIRADERRMRQALGHIVGNAVKYTGAMGSVSVGAQQDAVTGDLLLVVRDTGIGIAETELERVFEPFTQVQAAPRGRPGAASESGLGLYISRTLMRAHGGDLVLRSTPGQGTTATLRIPAKRVLHDDGRVPT